MYVVFIVLLGGFIRKYIVDRISARNVQRIKDAGGVEYGRRNTIAILILYNLYYYGSELEVIIRNPKIDYLTYIGICMYIFSFVVLFYAIKTLKEFYTGKLYLSTTHVLNTGFLFRTIRHPIYYLSILPEIIAITLICKSFIVSGTLIPLFIINIIFRIRIEEKMLKSKFSEY